MLPVVNVGAADADRADPDEHLVGTGVETRPVVDAKLQLWRKHGGLHSRAFAASRENRWWRAPQSWQS